MSICANAVVVMTGAAVSIGFASAGRFAASCCRVVVFDLDGESPAQRPRRLPMQQTVQHWRLSPMLPILIVVVPLTTGLSGNSGQFQCW